MPSTRPLRRFLLHTRGRGPRANALVPGNRRRDSVLEHHSVFRLAGGRTADGVSIMMPVPPKQPALSTDPDYSRAIYYDPPSHDFTSWLVAAEMNRRFHNAPAPLRVTFCTIDGQLGK